MRQDKCVIGVPEVNCNSHRLSAAGIRPLTSNVEAIQAISVPVNVKQLLRFVCMASYYLKFFFQNFAEICEPLCQLLKVDAVWNWSTACQHSFKLLKTEIISLLVPAYFDVNASTIVTCDASSVAVGACLSQTR